MLTISIIVPTYNVRDYILQCLESVAAQTYTGQIECLVVDDCGHDDSMALTEQFINDYHGSINFKVIHREKNGGLSAARNSGIKMAKGDYLYFLDSDDFISADCIEQLCTVAEKYPDADIIQGATESANKMVDRLSLKRVRDASVPEFLGSHYASSCLMKNFKIFPMTAWNRLIKTDFLIQNNLYFKEGIIQEDDYWTFFASRVIKGIAFCYKTTYFYRDNTNGIMSSTPNEIIYGSKVVLLQDILSSLPQDRCRKLELEFVIKSLTELRHQTGKNAMNDVETPKHDILKYLTEVHEKRFVYSSYTPQGVYYRVLFAFLRRFVLSM